MTGKFRLALSHTLRWEGGYVNDPVDPGGETNMGISKRSYPHEDIKGLTFERVAEIYYQDYWMKAHCQDLESYKVAAKYFDLCVNMGTNTCAKLLQRAINLAKDNSLIVDGVVGPRTLSAANELGDELLPYIIKVATNRYESIIQRNPKMEKYRKGWMNRLKDTL